MASLDTIYNDNWMIELHGVRKQQQGQRKGKEETWMTITGAGMYAEIYKSSTCTGDVENFYSIYIVLCIT